MDTYVAPTPAIRTSRILVGVIVVAIVGALALGVALATRAISFDALTTTSTQDALVRVHPRLGPGYPPHYGLAGPSGVVRGDYPMGGAPAHGGLAGPSGVVRGDYPIGGAPAHGGLAGPSGVVRGDYPMGGAPAHGGLAGPSGVGSSH
jgi:hypothetical protein